MSKHTNYFGLSEPERTAMSSLPPPPDFGRSKLGGGGDYARHITTFPFWIFRPSNGPATNKPTAEWGHYEYPSILRGLHIDDNYIAHLGEDP